MADSAFKINQGITLSPQTSVPTNFVNGDVYYDANLNTYALCQNGKWINLASRVDVASAASLKSTEFTTAVVQNSIVRITGSTTADIHGLTASVDAKQVVIYNNSSATATVKNNSITEGTAANRIVTPAGTDVAVTAGQSVVLAYDSAQSRWVVISSSGGGGGGGAVTTLTATAGENLTALDAVYIASSTDTGRTLGRAYKLDVTNDNRAEFVGFVTGSVSSGSTATIQIAGPLTGFTGLPTGKPIFGSTTTPGSYQTSAPTLSGQYIIQLGESVSSTDIAINAAASATAIRIVSNTLSSATAPYIKNYVLNSDFESNTANSWSLFNTTLNASKLPTGSITAGAASLNSLSATASGKLAGGYSLSVSSPGAITAGHGFISDAFTIDAEDQAKVLGFRFAYSKVSGTVDFSGTSANTFAVYIYDTTAGTWIQPAGVYNLVQGSGVGICTGTFQTAAASTQYRIAVICITATAGAVSMLFDDFYVGPQPSLIAPAMSDWQSYTPSWTAFTSNPAIGNGTIVGKWRREGDSGYYQIQIVTGSTTTYGSGTYLFSLPSGQTIDYTKTSFPGAFDDSLIPGSARILKSATDRWEGMTVNYAGAGNNAVGVALWQATSAGTNPVNISGNAVFSATVPAVFSGAGNVFTLEFGPVPITGWSSNTISSADTDTRVVAFAGSYINSQTVPAGPSNIILNYASVTDSTASWNGNTYTVPVSGFYSVSAGVRCEATPTSNDKILNLLINSSSIISLDILTMAGYVFLTGSVIRYFKAGDQLQLQLFYASGASFNTGPNIGYVSINRLSGPAVVQATETVAASYSNSGGQTLVTSGPYVALTTNWIKTTDSHSFFNTGSGVATIPVSGRYLCTFTLAPSTNLTGLFNVALNQAGSVSLQKISRVTNPTLYSNVLVAFIFQCVAGDTITPQVQTNASSASVNPDSAQNLFTIQRIGN